MTGASRVRVAGRAAALAFAAALLPILLAAQTPADSAAIRSAALDYIEGWYTADAGRMERAVHPDLAKRIVRRGTGEIIHTTAPQLVDQTDAKDPTAIDERCVDVVILDIFENAASVRVTATDWIDYMHLARVDGEWRIINVLWELSPEGWERMERAARERRRGG